VPDPSIALRLTGVIKDYRGLRPLRVRHLEVAEGESVALLGFDAAAAEVMVTLLIAGSMPDTGEVIVFGRPTSAIDDHAGWLTMLDQFGLVSERAVLLEQLTAEQNMAMPLSLAVETMPGDLRSRVSRLAAEAGVTPSQRATAVAQLSADDRLRVRLARALALDPRLLLAEHPNATLTAAEALRFAADVVRITRERGLTTLVMTADAGFARAIADRVLTLEPATGELKPTGSWRRWF
jgi:ABC-type methionine transport system ATPase subunit